MNKRGSSHGTRLCDGATVVVVGGGPAGAFFSTHLLQRARAMDRPMNVVVIERRCRTPRGTGGGSVLEWTGCKCCAGGISPSLHDELDRLNIQLPAAVIQTQIHSITIAGHWKNIELAVPAVRRMSSVFRGTRPASRADPITHFDAVLLERARAEGARVIGGEVVRAERLPDGRLVVDYVADGVEGRLVADFLVFAAGVNGPMVDSSRTSLPHLMQALAAGYRPPRLRPALIFELEWPRGAQANLDGGLHFVEYGSADLRLDMCSIMPKGAYVTVVLVGSSVDDSSGAAENKRIIEDFLRLPHVREVLFPGARLRLACACHPWMVVDTARRPFADRVAAIGDMATTRLYKDGILSAHHTASALAETLLSRGADSRSLAEGYAPILCRFRRDNRFAAVVFWLHRVFFHSSVLSRILYQAVITERKTRIPNQRRLEQLLWKIATGDDSYEAIFRAMIHPATFRSVLTGGVAITLRNYLTECLFGLKWEGFGRFTTGVAREQMDAKRTLFHNQLHQFTVPVSAPSDFERMYTIHIRAEPAAALHQLGRFGEIDRSYLRPRWVRIRRVEGQANELGCVIRYDLFGTRFSFDVKLVRIAEGRLVIYQVRDGFARGGVLLFEVEPAGKGSCDLSIYVAFRFQRGRSAATRLGWWFFRRLFPGYAHDVLWNHSLCQLKSLAEIETPSRESGS